MAANESQVDATFPPDNVAVDKSLMRAQFATIKSEITTLLQRTAYARRIAYGEISMTNI